MKPPHIQPYQAASGRGGGSSSPSKQPRSGWQQNAATAGAVWFGGWLLGYGFFWPLSVLLWFLSVFTPFGGAAGWLNRGAPVPDVYPAATELRIPGSQVPRYVESYVQSYGDAALIFAAHDGYAQLVQGLLVSKDLGYADLVDAADESGHTALLYASGRGFTQVAAALLHAGADPDAPRQGKAGGGLTPLMEAAGTGQREVVTLLLQANATIDLPDETGNTALMYAAYAGQLGALQELLQRGAKRDLVNGRGESALVMASNRGHQALVDALQRGARPVVEGPAGRRSRLAPTASAGGVQGAHAGGRQGTDTGAAAMEAQAKSKGRAAEHPEPKKGTDGDEDSDKSAASLLSTLLGKAAEKAAPEKASASATSGDPTGAAAAATARIKKLEAELAEATRTHEEAELKAQRRIVQLLEQNSDKQKLLDEGEKEHGEARRRAGDLEAKLRLHESQALDDEARSTRLAKEAHDARMEAERERTRADVAERERDRQLAETRRARESTSHRGAESGEQTRQMERLQEQLRALRAEVDMAQEERREAQRQVAELRASGLRPAHAVAEEGTPASAAAPPEAPQEAPGSAATAAAEHHAEDGQPPTQRPPADHADPAGTASGEAAHSGPSEATPAHAPADDAAGGGAEAPPEAAPPVTV